MSPVGHSLVGMSCAAIAIQWVPRPLARVGIAIGFVALANLPDWPIPGWGHDRYDISHSVFVNSVMIAALFLLFFKRVGRAILVLGAIAWLSHLLLDSFYNHNRGIAIYWPFSNDRLNFGMPWFNNLDLSQSASSNHNLMVFAIEAVAFAPLFALVVAIAYWCKKHPRRAKRDCDKP